MQISIIGRGRLGRSLEVLLRRAGHQVQSVGRDEDLPARGVRILTVPDTAIATVAALLPRGGPVLHCAGSLDHDVLRPHTVAGSLHPLMTFPGPEVALPDLEAVPAAIAGDDEARAIAGDLARDLGMVPFEVPGDRRLYHAGAVIAGNLSMVLIHAAAEALQAAGVPRDEARHALVPLALRSVRNAVLPLREGLTGPLARDDRQTMTRHREALEEHGLTSLRAIYDDLVTWARLDLRLEEADEDHTG